MFGFYGRERPLIGLLAGFLGVGGGVMTVPILLDVFAGQLPPTIVDAPVLSLFSFPIKRAIGAGALFNLARPAGQAMRWAMRCFAWRRCHCLRSLSRP